MQSWANVYGLWYAFAESAPSPTQSQPNRLELPMCKWCRSHVRPFESASDHCCAKMNEKTCLVIKVTNLQADVHRLSDRTNCIRSLLLELWTNVLLRVNDWVLWLEIFYVFHFRAIRAVLKSSSNIFHRQFKWFIECKNWILFHSIAGPFSLNILNGVHTIGSLKIVRQINPINFPISLCFPLNIESLRSQWNRNHKLIAMKW